MNSKERVHGALRRKPVDRLPVFMWFHPETETTTEPTAEQLDAIAAAEAKIESLKADLAKARVELSAFKKGPGSK